MEVERGHPYFCAITGRKLRVTPISRATCENVRSRASTRRTASSLNSSLEVLFRVFMTPHLPGVRQLYQSARGNGTTSRCLMSQSHVSAKAGQDQC